MNAKEFSKTELLGYAENGNSSEKGRMEPTLQKKKRETSTEYKGHDKKLKG